MTVSASNPNGSYSVHFYFAWKVILTLTNTSSTTFQIEAQRTMAAALYAEGKVATASANLTVTAWDLETGFANFTTSGSVYESTPSAGLVPALAMVNENAWASSNITETLTANWNNAAGPQRAYLYATIASDADMQVSFLPSLGLFPLNPTTGESWTSSSAFSADAQYGVGWHVFGTPPWSFTYDGSGSPVSFQGSGELALNGTDYGTIPLGDINAAVIGLTITSPTFSFDDHDGILLIPTKCNLFNQGALNDSGVSGAPSSQVFSTERIDVNPESTQQGGIIAASSRYGSSSIFGSTPTSSAILSNAVPAATSPTAVLQANPISVSTAQSWCLYNCPGQNPGSTSKLGGILLLGILVVVIAVVAVAWTGRRRKSEPVPPAPQYARPMPAGAFAPTSPQPGDGKDPVGFYW
jgi:hypothetical protein